MPAMTKNPSVHRNRGQQATVLVKAIASALGLQRAVLAEVSVPDLGIVPDLLDDIEGPLVIEAKIAAPARFEPENLFDLGIACRF